MSIRKPEEYKPYPYQEHAEDHVLENPESGLFLDMGLGKTVICLSAINKLMYRDFEINKVLVVAPKLVSLTVWHEELMKWEHLKHISYSIITGSETKRIAALNAKADVYIINREMVPWLVTYLQSGWRFDMVILDELTSFKNHESKRFKSLKIIRPRIKRIIGLTGTPASNGLIDLWAQMFLIDRGERLGKFVTQYREAYFTFDPYKYKYKISEIAEQEIYKRIGDICISMKKEDYHDLPPIKYIDVPVEFSKRIMDKYYEFEREKVLELVDEANDAGTEITAVNAMVLAGKLAQFTSGAIYDEDKKVIEIHKFKLEALEELLESMEGEHVITAYNFKHDLTRIQKKFPEFIQLRGMKEKNAWVEGKLKRMIAHPASAGHGMNDLQYNGSIIIFFSFTRSRELYEQIINRLYRPGQEKPVRVFRMIARNTIDEDIILSLEEKAKTEKRLLNAVKARIKKYSQNANFKF